MPINLTPADYTAIETAVWSHPTGVAYQAKLTEIAACCQNFGQTKRSGTVRLWMYEIYSKSIEEDHKRRGLIKEEIPIVVAKTPITAVKLAKSKAKPTAKVLFKPSTPAPSLPHYAPAFVFTRQNTEIVAQIDEVLDNLTKNPLIYPIVQKRTVNRVIEQERSAIAVRRKRRKKQELLLLLAA